ncbi:hypothetical protein BV22DRAFT_1183183 [Leucogyrophana mollusca]|uniref:Uncharacterized protein n=1 Tax=Leucogyrophana mollusca TaxID=85980 RepID=A0ACB8B2C7_9AGAM|nr:hypothetical protein BV22DRAFT_1183183 [Leucogyrophana mollusca]
MKLSYPPSIDSLPLSDSALALKIARHSPCSICDSCLGLHPPPDVELVVDEDAQTKSSLGDLTQYGSDDEDGPAYLENCACGHDVADHGAQLAIGKEELARRGRVAFRLDELLQDLDKLLDFEYTDDDIISLRQQMKLPVSFISTTSPSGESPVV